MRLLIDAVGLSINSNNDLCSEIARIIYDKLAVEYGKKSLDIHLITDGKGGEKYVRKPSVVFTACE